jgi:tRNA (guanine37-N1)-methyltransferase
MRIPIDTIGDIAILKFSRWAFWPYKKYYAWKLLRNDLHLKVVLEKIGKFSGVLRKQETKWLAGEKRKDTIHRENNCQFFLDIDETYFSPRLSYDRKLVAEDILKEILSKKIKSPKCLVMFAGVGPFSVVLADVLRKNKIEAEIISSELNEKASEYAEKNVRMNKLNDYIKVVSGDSKKLCEKLSTHKGSSRNASRKQQFDFILMPRPNLEDTFLVDAMKVAKKGTVFYYHGFGEEKEVVGAMNKDIKLTKRKVSKFEIRKCGDIGVNKFRFTIKFKVL